MSNHSPTSLMSNKKPSPHSIQHNILLQLPKLVFWKDSGLVYLGCNNNVADFFGLSNHSEIVGLTDDELPLTTKQATMYQEEDSLILNGTITQIKN
ncbi:unnamed protein product, partial [marine sediment metagenome]